MAEVAILGCSLWDRGRDRTHAEVTITHSIPSCAQSVIIALEEKGIPYIYIPIDIEFATKPKLMLEANLMHKKVPTIIHNGKPVAGSQIILEYLEDAYPQQVPLMPKDAFERSQVRVLADYVYKISDKFVEAARAPAGSPKRKAALEASIKALKALDTAMTTFSSEGPFFAGGTFGFLDAVVAPMGNVLMLVEKLGGLALPGPDEIPRFYKCLEASAALPSYKKVVPSREDTLQLYKGLFEKRKARAPAAAAEAAPNE